MCVERNRIAAVHSHHVVEDVCGTALEQLLCMDIMRRMFVWFCKVDVCALWIRMYGL